MLKRFDPLSLVFLAFSAAIADWLANLGLPILHYHVVNEFLLAAVCVVATSAFYLLIRVPALIRVSRKIPRAIGRRLEPLCFRYAWWPGSNRIRAWRNATAKLISEHKNTEVRDIINAFVTTYAEEEARHLNGDGTAKRQVYTSFASYAALVKSIVEAAKGVATAQGDDLICFTTLALPLPEWFNFHIRSASSPGKDGEPPNAPLQTLESRMESVATWDSYIRYMHSLIHPVQAGSSSGGPTPWVDVYRVILVKKKEWQEPRGTSFATSAAMRGYINRDLLVHAQHGLADYGQMPRRMDDSGTWISWDEHLSDNLAALYKNCCPAYVIAEHSIGTGTSPIERFKWVQLGEAFRSLFHHSPMKRCFIAELGDQNNSITQAFMNAGDDIPQDFFLIGLRLKNHGSVDDIRWMCGLGAHVIEEDDSVTVELLSDYPNPYRLHLFKDYANTLIRSGETNQNDVAEIGNWLERRT